MRQCFFNTENTCFEKTAYIPPACEASGSKRCPADTTFPTPIPAWIKWTCIPGYNTPVRLALDGEDQVPACMTEDGKSWLVEVCPVQLGFFTHHTLFLSLFSIYTASFSECQILAAIPKPDALALTCGQKFAEAYGASGYSYNPETWCTAAYYALQSPAVIHHWPFAPIPPLAYTCVPGIFTPLTIIPETGETACMIAPRTENTPPSCLWATSRASCQALVASPPPNIDINNAFSCGNWYRQIYGWSGYNESDPTNWCSAGRKHLYVNTTDLNGTLTLFPTATTTTMTSMSIATETLTGTIPLPTTPYYCLPGVFTPIRVAPNNVDVACMSMDGYLCYWLTSTEECQAAAGKGDMSTSFLSCVGC
jgi:hypothetical protein